MRIDYRLILIFLAIYTIIMGFVAIKLYILINPHPEIYDGQVEIFGLVEKKIVHAKGEAAPSQIIDLPEEDLYSAELETTFEDLDGNMIDLWVVYEVTIPGEELFMYEVEVTIPEQEEKITVNFDTLFIEKPIVRVVKERIKIPLFSPVVLGGYWTNYGPEESTNHVISGAVGLAIKKTVVPHIEVNTRGWIGLKIMVIF